MGLRSNTSTTKPRPGIALGEVEGGGDGEFFAEFGLGLELLRTSIIHLAIAIKLQLRRPGLPVINHLFPAWCMMAVKEAYMKYGKKT
jgi:hypothetical protein